VGPYCERQMSIDSPLMSLYIMATAVRNYVLASDGDAFIATGRRIRRQAS
jgi:hypothetical protein